MKTEPKIRELADAYLADNHRVDGVRFIDELLAVAAEVGEVSCSFAGDRQLRFQAPAEPAWEIELGRARSKLRLLCARLAVLCNQSGNQDVSIYGGEGIISEGSLAKSSAVLNGPGQALAPTVAVRSRPAQWAVRFKNTPSEQEFTIVAQ